MAFPGSEFRRTRTAPTGYEKVRLLFHGIRTAQCIASVITASFLIYFIYWLAHDHYSWPWTFVILTVTSFLTLLALTASLTMHCLTGLSPKFNLFMNTALFILWALGFGMLSYWAWGTMSNECSVANWRDTIGVMVCRIYKALFTFSLLGLIATLCAVILDLHIHRLTIQRGAHMRLDTLDAKRQNGAPGPYADDAFDHRDDPEDFATRPSEAFERPQQLYGGAGHQRSTSNVNAKLMHQEGYEVPDGQFGYDTGYHGGHAERVFGQS